MGCCGSSQKVDPAVEYDPLQNHGSKTNKNGIGKQNQKSPVEIRVDDKKLEDVVEEKHEEKAIHRNELKSSFRRKRELPPELPKEIEISDTTALKGHTQNVDLCEWSPRQDVLVTAGTDRKVFLWDLQKGSASPQPKQIELDDKTDSASCLHWAEDGTFFAMGTEHGHVMLWSSSGRLLDTWTPHEGATRAVQCNGDLVASVGDVVVCVYQRKKKTWRLSAWNQDDNVGQDVSFTDVEWISDKEIVVADSQGTMRMDEIWDRDFHKQTEHVEDHIRLDPPDPAFRSHAAGIYRLLKHPSRARVFVSCSVDATIKIWKAPSGSGKGSSKPVLTLDGHFGYVVDMRWLANTDLLASASYDGSVRIWNSRSGDCLHLLEGHRDHVCKLAATDDGQYLASAGHDGSVHFWSAETGDLVSSYEGPGRMLQVAFSPSGKMAAVTSYGAAEILRLKFNRKH